MLAIIMYTLIWTVLVGMAYIKGRMDQAKLNHPTWWEARTLPPSKEEETDAYPRK
jgi:hypothetical protein